MSSSDLELQVQKNIPPDYGLILTNCVCNKALEQKAVADHQNKMEQWSDMLEQLQMEEEKVLAAHGEPLRNYLMKYVLPTLGKGLVEAARLKPDDPVDFLAEYLFKENPEGHMFDPAYTREGKRILDQYEQKAKMNIKHLGNENND